MAVWFVFGLSVVRLAACEASFWVVSDGGITPLDAPVINRLWMLCA